MHIPDGLINDPRIWLAGDAVAAAVYGYAIHRESRTLKPEEAPLIGVMAAFIFAGQMFNVPVSAGVSGHLLGALLAAALLGPWRATIVMGLVITVQCLLHADGGLTVLGINIINMGLAGTLVGWLIYAGIRAILPSRTGILVGGAVAGWASVVLGALLAGVEIALTGPPDLVGPIKAMVFVHIPIGLLEAGITVGALTVILKARPDLLGLKIETSPQTVTAGALEVTE
ncbi:MAG: energy-coupling factor ABC transporter permease [Candidatus Zipacnadales bacterium]